MKLNLFKLNKREVKTKFEELMKKIFEKNQDRVEKERSFIKSYLYHGSCRFHYLSIVSKDDDDEDRLSNSLFTKQLK